MVRHLIIDGYNLLGARGQMRSTKSDGTEAREALLRQLAAYRQARRHPITVVFDGWRQPVGAASREFRSGVEVLYSPRGQQADQMIQQLAEEYGADCAVVSSDREVADYARARGALVLGAMEFDRKLRETAGPGSRRAPAGPDRDPDKVPRSSVEKKGNPRKLPKAVRKRLRQLKSF